jgi:uncharacterized Zn finger protein (UPF0148 family)
VIEMAEYCNNCGTKLRKDGIFCEGCGRKIITGEEYKKQRELELRKEMEAKLKKEIEEEIRKEIEEKNRKEVEESKKKVELSSYFNAKPDIKTTAFIGIFALATSFLIIILSILTGKILINYSTVEHDYINLGIFNFARAYRSVINMNWLNLIAEIILYMIIIFVVAYIVETMWENKKILKKIGK